ncbi:MAG TPA: histidine phosphatase family protein [Beijerinckiaceae bacterium]|jgi:phosphohistidine phosphatase SixA
MKLHFLICALLLIAPSAAADPAAAWAALRQGGHVALMRHADAPGGAGDPPGFRLDDCATQRNLSPKGRVEAAAAGAKLKAQGVTVAKVLSSPWCRCLDTARLMDVGPVEIEEAFGNAFVLRDRRDALAAGARAVIDAWRGGTLLVVTHGANIQALTGINPASGEIVVVAPGGGGPLVAVGRIPPPDL